MLCDELLKLAQKIRSGDLTPYNVALRLEEISLIPEHPIDLADAKALAAELVANGAVPVVIDELRAELARATEGAYAAHIREASAISRAEAAEALARRLQVSLGDAVGSLTDLADNLCGLQPCGNATDAVKAISAEHFRLRARAEAAEARVCELEERHDGCVDLLARYDAAQAELARLRNAGWDILTAWNSDHGVSAAVHCLRSALESTSATPAPVVADGAASALDVQLDSGVAVSPPEGYRYASSTDALRPNERHGLVPVDAPTPQPESEPRDDEDPHGIMALAKRLETARGEDMHRKQSWSLLEVLDLAGEAVRAAKRSTP